MKHNRSSEHCLREWYCLAADVQRGKVPSDDFEAAYLNIDLQLVIKTLGDLRLAG